MQSEDGDDGNHGIAQGVAVDDGSFRKSFGARGANIVLTQFFQHGCAHHAGEDRGQSAAHGNGGKHEVGESSGTGHGKQSEIDGKN